MSKEARGRASRRTMRLSPGMTFRLNGETLIYLTLTPENEVICRSARGTTEVVPFDLALAAFRAEANPEDRALADAQHGSYFNLQSERAKAVALQRLSDVLEVNTGYRSGNPDAETLPPRSGYDPRTTTLTQRQQTKATDREVSFKTIGNWRRNYREHDLPGLLDERQAQDDTLDWIDGPWRQAALTYISSSWDRSRVSLAKQVADINDLSGVKFGRDRGIRALDALNGSRGGLRGDTYQQQTEAKQPKREHGETYSGRPGEFLLADSTPLSLYAIDRHSREKVVLELSIVLDLSSRCIVALRLSPTTRRTDISALLYEVIKPPRNKQPLLPYVGVPDNLAFITPEAFVFDHGKPYKSKLVAGIAELLGTNIDLATKGNPLGKPQVETVFGSLDEFFEECPGYKGYRLSRRGKHPEQEHLLYIEEVEALLRKYIHDVYHKSIHDGISLPHAPGLKTTPIDAFMLGRKRFGEPTLPLSDTMVYEFLDMGEAVVGHRGIRFMYVDYNGEALNPWRNRRNPKKRGSTKFAFRYNPSDVSCIFFQDPVTDQWSELRWKWDKYVDTPFSEEERDLALTYYSEVDRANYDTHELFQMWRADYLSGVLDDARVRRLTVRRNEEKVQLLDDVAEAPRSRPKSAPTPAWITDDDPDGDDAEAGDLMSADDYYDEAPELV